MQGERTGPGPTSGSERPSGPPHARREGRRFIPRRRVCQFCVEKAQRIDYKEPQRFRRFMSDRAKIEPRRKTGTCARHQRMLVTALKRARHLALLPFTQEHIRLTGVLAPRPAA